MSQYTAAFDEDQELGIRDYLRAAGRRKGRATLVAAIVFALVALITFLWPTKYESSATILLEQQEIPQDMVRSTITSFADQRIQIISQQVMTTANLLGIIAKYDLYPDMVDSRPREEVLEEMRGDISMNTISAEVVDPRSGRPTSATIAFTLAYRGRSPDQALKVANELTNLYLQKNVESRTELASEITVFLANEAERLNVEIRELEEALSSFKAENVNRLPELSQMNLSLLDRSERELSDIQRQMRSLDERRIYLESEAIRLSGAEALFSQDGERIYAPQDRIKMLEAQLATYESMYADKHPDVSRTRREIDSLRAALNELPGNATRSDEEILSLRAEREALAGTVAANHPDILALDRAIEGRAAAADGLLGGESTDPAYVQIRAQLTAVVSEQRSLTAMRDEVRSRIAGLERRLAETPLIEKDYVALNLELDNARQKYRDVKAREMEAVLAQNMETDRKGERLTLIEPPLPPEQPASPDRPLLLTAGLFVSLLAGIVTIVLAEATDTSIRSVDVLEKLTELPVLGLIPAIRSDEDRRQRKRRIAIGSTAAVATVLVLIAVVHTVVVPVDVLFYSALRRFDL